MCVVGLFCGCCRVLYILQGFVYMAGSYVFYMCFLGVAGLVYMLQVLFSLQNFIGIRGFCGRSSVLWVLQASAGVV